MGSFTFVHAERAKHEQTVDLHRSGDILAGNQPLFLSFFGKLQTVEWESVFLQSFFAHENNKSLNVLLIPVCNNVIRAKVKIVFYK